MLSIPTVTERRYPTRDFHLFYDEEHGAALDGMIAEVNGELEVVKSRGALVEVNEIQDRILPLLKEKKHFAIKPPDMVLVLFSLGKENTKEQQARALNHGPCTLYVHREKFAKLSSVLRAEIAMWDNLDDLNDRLRKGCGYLINVFLMRFWKRWADKKVTNRSGGRTDGGCESACKELDGGEDHSPKRDPPEWAQKEIEKERTRNLCMRENGESDEKCLATLRAQLSLLKQSGYHKILVRKARDQLLKQEIQLEKLQLLRIRGGETRLGDLFYKRIFVSLKRDSQRQYLTKDAVMRALHVLYNPQESLEHVGGEEFPGVLHFFLQFGCEWKPLMDRFRIMLQERPQVACLELAKQYKYDQSVIGDVDVSIVKRRERDFLNLESHINSALADFVIQDFARFRGYEKLMFEQKQAIADRRIEKLEKLVEDPHIRYRTHFRSVLPPCCIDDQPNLPLTSHERNLMSKEGFAAYEKTSGYQLRLGENSPRKNKDVNSSISPEKENKKTRRKTWFARPKITTRGGHEGYKKFRTAEQNAKTKNQLMNGILTKPKSHRLADKDAVSYSPEKRVVDEFDIEVVNSVPTEQVMQELPVYQNLHAKKPVLPQRNRKIPRKSICDDVVYTDPRVKELQFRDEPSHLPTKPASSRVDKVAGDISNYPDWSPRIEAIASKNKQAKEERRKSAAVIWTEVGNPLDSKGNN